MSSLEINKWVAAILTAGVVAMLASFIGDVLTHRVPMAERAYTVETGAEPAPSSQPAQPAIEPIAPLIAAADAAAGQRVAKKCTACHTLTRDGAHKIGPNLWGVVGRAVASAQGYSYSKALDGKSAEAWSYATLNAFLAKPKDWAPGTKMSFAGVRKTADRANLVAYLRGLSDSPAPLPE